MRSDEAAGRGRRWLAAAAEAVCRTWPVLRGRLASRLPRRRSGLLIVLGLVFLVAIDLVALTDLLADPAGYRALGHWSPVTFGLFTAITRLGDAAVYLVPSGVVLLALPFLPAPGRRLRAALAIVWMRLAFVFVAVSATGIAVNVVKRAIGRMRPHHLDGAQLWQFDPFAWKAAAASFPSGHATTAWCAAVALALLLGRRWRAPLAAMALLVCVSRVVLGAHFVTDVVAGAFFGGLGTWLLARFLANRRLVFRFSSTGALVLRGPGAAKTARDSLRPRGGAG